MSLIESSAAPVFQRGGVRFQGLASPSRGSRENVVWRVRLEPGTPALPHQLTREEIFVAIEGSAEATVGDKRYRLEAGSALVVPPYTEFALANPGAGAFEAVVVLPVGGQAIVGGEAPFVPPWAQ